MPTTRSTCRSLESSSIRWSASPQSNPLEGAADICVEGSYRYWTGAIVALFTQRPRRGILRSSALRRSKKFAPNRSRWHHAYGGKGWPAGFSKAGRKRRSRRMQPTRVLPAVSVLSLISVEYGGWALLGYLTGRGQLGRFREQFFRAGHAHAGVLLILSLVYYLHLDRTGYSDGVKWLAGGLLQAGVLPQSGGFFVHLGLGQPNRSSLGTVVTRLGAVLIAAALVILAVGLLRSGHRD